MTHYINLATDLERSKKTNKFYSLRFQKKNKKQTLRQMKQSHLYVIIGNTTSVQIKESSFYVPNYVISIEANAAEQK